MGADGIVGESRRGRREMGAIFDIPNGERSKITSETVNIHNLDLNATGMLKTEVSYEATATDQYMQGQDGTRRRLFTNTSIEFAGHHEIWLSDGPAKDSDWPDELPKDCKL